MANKAELLERIRTAQHAMQTGVAYENAKLPYDFDHHKHLRVGVNSAMVEIGALAELLISKGIITEEEILSAYAKGHEREQTKYEEIVSKLYGANIKLG